MTPDECKRFILTHYPLTPAKDLAVFLGMSVDSVRSIAHGAGVFHLGGKAMNIGGILCKRCSHCGVTKELEHFYNDPNHKSGVTSWCATCTYIRTKHKCPTCGQHIKGDKKSKRRGMR